MPTTEKDYMRLSLIIAFLLATVALGAAPAEYLKVPAVNGDGVFSLLRRYALDRHSCNHQLFYTLNAYQKNQGLRVGKYYQMPIRVYAYDGKSIRSTIGKNDWELAVKIQTYNEEMHTQGRRPLDYRKDKVLWVPHHLLTCDRPDIPVGVAPADQGENLANAEGGSRSFPIFGKKYQQVPLRDNSLAGRVFYIVSGHGGPDPGAIGKRAGKQLCEDEYAYDVALRLTRKLIAHGATAYMIVRDPNDGIRDEEILKCDYDEVVWGNEKIFRSQKARLTQRSSVINELFEKHRAQGVTDQRVIAIHVDSRSTNTRTDLFFYYHPDSPRGKTLAQRMYRVMKQKYERYRANGQYSGTITGRDLHMLRETKAPTVYIELGNIRNRSDQKRIILKDNREALAKWMYEGIIAR